MWIMIAPMIFMIVLLILFVFFLFITKNQEKNLKTIDKEGKIKQEEKKNPDKEEEDKKNADNKVQYKKEDVFKFMEFDRILDKMIVQNGGSRFTMAIRCKGINYDLMSEVEQLSVEEGFITFLNTLKFPIQLYVQAQNIDLKGNVERYRNNIQDLTRDYNDINEQYNKLASSFDVDEKKMEDVTKERDKISNVYEYANDIIKYVEKMSLNKNLLQRKFFILISYNTSEINAVDKFNKDEIIEMCSTELITRCNGIISALSSCSVSGEILDSNELADLLYSAYNRDDKSLMSVREAIENGMLRLYSTSEDAFSKQEEKLEEYLTNQAQLKAYKAIKYAKEHDELETPVSEVLEQTEEVARRATNFIKNSDYSPEEKKIASDKILSDYRNDKKELNAINEIQKREMEKMAEEDIQKIDELEKQEKPKGIQLIEKSKQIKKNDENNNDENNNNNEDNLINNSDEIKEESKNENVDEKSEDITNNIYSDNIDNPDEDDDDDDEIIR